MMCNMVEIWKDIKNYEGLYQVSNLGRVKSFRNWHGKSERILKFNINSSGYYRACLSKNSKQKYFFVHRLVAQAFIDNPNNYSVVNHKDENPKNNNVENLEWCTFKYNMNYGTLRKRQVEKCSKKVFQIDKNGNLIYIWNSIREAGRNLKISPGRISNCCLKRRNYNTVGGYIWRFADE
nr:MAG TPA: homing endonuclease [Bacteriophage sp.]